MSKPHKFAWNGIDVETRLSIEQLVNMAQRAAQECTGDMARGRQRISSTKSNERQIEFRINDFQVAFKKYLVFHLDFETRGDRTWMSSSIDWYMANPSKVPFGAKIMVGHHVYMEFVHHLANQVKAADAQARVTIREGVAATGAAAAKPTVPAAQPTPAPNVPPAPSVAPRWTATPPPITAVPPGAGMPMPPPPPPGPVFPPPPAPSPAAAVQAPSGSVGTGFGGITGAPRASAVPPTDAGGLVTSVPGMPARPVPAAPPPREFVPTGFASIAEQLFAEDEDLDHTRLVQLSPQALPWCVRFPNGTEITLIGALVLGRNPAAPHATVADPVPVGDPQRSVSKTHALLELRDGLPWVTDLHSTNGTTLTNDVGEALACEPGIAVPVGDGWAVGLGEYSLAVLRKPAPAIRS